MLLDSRPHAFEERMGHFLSQYAHEPCREAGNRSDDGDIGGPGQHRGAVGAIGESHLAAEAPGRSWTNTIARYVGNLLLLA